MAALTEVWTCETCGRRTPGTGDEGLWPPEGWEGADASVLVGRCAEHRSADAGNDGSAREDHRWFPGGGA